MKSKAKKPATSLPPSLKKTAGKTKPTPPPAPAPKPSVRVNVHPIIQARDKGVLNPEEYNVGAFGMSERTRAAVLAHLEVKVEEYEGYLYGVRVFPSESIPFGKVHVCDPKAKIIDTLTVIEA